MWVRPRSYEQKGVWVCQTINSLLYTIVFVARLRGIAYLALHLMGTWWGSLHDKTKPRRLVFIARKAVAHSKANVCISSAMEWSDARRPAIADCSWSQALHRHNIDTRTLQSRSLMSRGRTQLQIDKILAIVCSKCSTAKCLTPRHRDAIEKSLNMKIEHCWWPFSTARSTIRNQKKR